MTREHKLALLVGFGLVLVVGILISDHFSKARTAQLSADVNADGAENFGAVALSEPEATLANPIPTDPLAAAAPDTAPLVPEPAPRGVEIVMGGSPPSLGDRPQIGGSDIGGAVMPGYGERAGGSLGVLGGQSLPYAAEVSTPVAVVPPEPEAGVLTTEVPVAPRQAASALPVSDGPLLSHEVVKGDNLTKITTKYYGDRTLWPLLQSYNTGRVAANGIVRQGTTLLIPPKDVLTGRARLAADAKAVPAGSAAASPRKPEGKPAAEKAPAKGARPSAKPAPRTYTVKSGDTLGKIAQRHLGATKRWREILDLNESKLDDEDSIRVGMVLALPAE